MPPACHSLPWRHFVTLWGRLVRCSFATRLRKAYKEKIHRVLIRWIFCLSVELLPLDVQHLRELLGGEDIGRIVIEFVGDIGEGASVPRSHRQLMAEGLVCAVPGIDGIHNHGDGAVGIVGVAHDFGLRRSRGDIVIVTVVPEEEIPAQRTAVIGNGTEERMINAEILVHIILEGITRNEIELRTADRLVIIPDVVG